MDTAYCVPGESYLGVLDAIGDSPIRLYTTRHEAAAANMADAYGKLTGRPGICLVTRAPGATHAAVGVHTAYQDSTPLVLLVGQVPRRHLGREAFQELDYTRMFGEMAKWVTTVDDAAAIPELVAHAFHTATSGRPGPVVIALPEDAQADEADVPDAAPYHPAQASPAADDVDRALELLAGAERPLLVVGGGGWSEQAGRDVVAFAEASNVPVVASFRRQDYVDNASPAYAGPLTIGMDPKLAQRVKDADVILALGTRLGEIATQQYSLLDVAAAAPDADPRPRRPRRARPRVRGRRCRSSPARRSSRPRSAPVDGAARAGWVESRARRLPREPAARPAARRRPARRRDGPPARAAPGRRGDHERRRQLHRVGAPLLRVPPLRHAARAVRRRDGLRRPGRGRREAAPPGEPGRLPRPATATS